MSGLEELSREELIALARALAGQVGALEKENGELRERVARLERLISRNSGNSGMPSSGDDLPGKPQPKAKPAKGGKGGKCRPGKQPGAPGTYLAWSHDPDKRVEHFPAGACGCGADLAQAVDLGVTARHQ